MNAGKATIIVVTNHLNLCDYFSIIIDAENIGKMFEKSLILGIRKIEKMDL